LLAIRPQGEPEPREQLGCEVANVQVQLRPADVAHAERVAGSEQPQAGRRSTGFAPKTGQGFMQPLDWSAAGEDPAPAGR